MKKIAIMVMAHSVAATAITPTVAHAANYPTVTSIVHIADLDLSSPAGQRRLARRIARAAREVCGTASPADLKGRAALRQCRERTTAEALNQSDRLLATANGGKARGDVM